MRPLAIAFVAVSLVLGVGFRVPAVAQESPDDAVSVPEPGTLLLLGTGIVGMAVAARKRRK